jgi:acyl-CoA synthetase
MKPLAEWIDAHAALRPHADAFRADDERLTWAGYARGSDRFATRLAEAGLEPGDRIGVVLPDGPGVHMAYVGAEKAGLVVVGIGPRAGAEEISHLLRETQARALLSPRRLRDLDLVALVNDLRREGLPLTEHFLDETDLAAELLAEAAPRPAREKRLAPDDLFLLNSTSGTTGLPKCVIHDQRRWLHFHELAVDAADLSDADVFLSALPAPFGFGIWTAHVTPTLLGATTVLLPRFDPTSLIRAIERHRVTVLAAVSTQFIMLLNAPELAQADLSSVRVLFTGGEAVPYGRAAEFEDRTGARVLQFYGSNETGALSRTTLRDSRDVRLGTAGHIIPGMNVRLYDEAGRDVTAGGHGRAACRGPLTSAGYYEDPEANAELFTEDGWMLTGDLASIDAEGVLRVEGRTADFIIRGGKNISGTVVEEAVGSHPAVMLAAAVAMPDPVYGERVCAYVELHPDRDLSLEALTTHLKAQGVSIESWPEHLVVLDALPRSSGGKVAKGALRLDAARRAAEGA